MDKEFIKQRARKLHIKLWKNRESLWPDRQITSYLDVIEPAAAAHILEFDYRELPKLHDEIDAQRGKNFKAAGILHRSDRVIAISTEYPQPTMRFTAAHEIGHIVLGHSGKIIHRDRPLDSTRQSGPRAPMEREADYFAACFLMPEKLLRNEFKDRFGNIPFFFDDATSFHLDPNDPDRLLRAEAGSLARESALACCHSYNGRHFDSLADVFRVSHTAMAIRINELGLIKWP